MGWCRHSADSRFIIVVEVPRHPVSMHPLWCSCSNALEVMSSSCCNVHFCCLGGRADVVFYQLAVAATVITGTKAVDHEMSFQRSNWCHAAACSSTCSRPEALLYADRRKIRHFQMLTYEHPWKLLQYMTITNHPH